MGKTTLVKHVNKVSGWENSKQREIFCKKEHKVVPADISKCEKCPYFATSGQGEAIICGWEDLPPAVGTTKVISQSDNTSELYRVSELIDAGILKKG